MGKVNEALTFSKDWKNHSDFPTYCDSEEQVRADIQLLFDEIKNYINQKLRPAVNTVEASEIETTGGSNVQADLSSLRSDLTGTVLGQIPDDSLTSEKLAPGGLMEDVSDSLTFTEQPMGAYPTDVSGLHFRFCKALGMMFVTGPVAFYKTGTGAFSARYRVTGPFNFGYVGSVFNHHSAVGKSSVQVTPFGNELQIDFSLSDVPSDLYENYASIDLSGWIFCEEVSS